MTAHASLVRRAERWLVNRMNCRFAIAEQPAGVQEIPDAIGFKCGNLSYLVEVKVSRADFLADREKPFRRDPALGMGLFRYFLTPPGMVKVEELPAGWGLLELRGRGVFVVRGAEPQPARNIDAELTLLVQCLAQAQSNLVVSLNEWLTGPGSQYGKARERARQERARTAPRRIATPSLPLSAGEGQS